MRRSRSRGSMRVAAEASAIVIVSPASTAASSMNTGRVGRAVRGRRRPGRQPAATGRGGEQRIAGRQVDGVGRIVRRVDADRARRRRLRPPPPPAPRLRPRRPLGGEVGGRLGRRRRVAATVRPATDPRTRRRRRPLVQASAAASTLAVATTSTSTSAAASASASSTSTAGRGSSAGASSAVGRRGFVVRRRGDLLRSTVAASGWSAPAARRPPGSPGRPRRASARRPRRRRTPAAARRAPRPTAGRRPGARAGPCAAPGRRASPRTPAIGRHRRAGSFARSKTRSAHRTRRGAPRCAARSRSPRRPAPGRPR